MMLTGCSQTDERACLLAFSFSLTSPLFCLFRCSHVSLSHFCSTLCSTYTEAVPLTISLFTLIFTFVVHSHHFCTLRRCFSALFHSVPLSHSFVLLHPVTMAIGLLPLWILSCFPLRHAVKHTLTFTMQPGNNGLSFSGHTHTRSHTYTNRPIHASIHTKTHVYHYPVLLMCISMMPKHILLTLNGKIKEANGGMWLN